MTEIHIVGCVVGSDSPVTVTEGQLFEVYRIVGGSPVTIATGAVRTSWDPQTFKLNPQDGGDFTDVLVGDLVQAA